MKNINYIIHKDINKEFKWLEISSKTVISSKLYKTVWFSLSEVIQEQTNENVSDLFYDNLEEEIYKNINNKKDVVGNFKRIYR